MALAAGKPNLRRSKLRKPPELKRKRRKPRMKPPSRPTWTQRSRRLETNLAQINRFNATKPVIWLFNRPKSRGTSLIKLKAFFRNQKMRKNLQPLQSLFLDLLE